MNFADVKEWRIPVNGIMTEVTKVTDSQNRIIWQKETDKYSGFWIKSLNVNATISFSHIGSGSRTIEYSRNGSDWNSETITDGQTITLNATQGNKVYFRCNTTRFGISNRSYTKIDVDEEYAVGGNIMSLLYGDIFDGTETTFPVANTNGAFYGLFYQSTLLKDASELILPVVDLLNAYSSASYNNNAYDSMFSGCTSLLYPPVLPATTLSPGCYRWMFSGCTSLTSASALPATTLAQSCYEDMFRNCTSMTKAPELPATTLVQSCYSVMFSGCTSLAEVKCYATSGINTNYSTLGWLNGVSSTGTFTKTAGVTWPSGDNGIPSGWTVVEV